MRTLTHPESLGRAGRREQRRQQRRERRDERRRLRRIDALSTRLVELHAMPPLLDTAAEVVARGWVQNAWFTVSSQQGPRALRGPDLHLAERRPVTGACLVGSVVEAAGGPHAVRTQLVQRTLDLLWHSLRVEDGRPVRWCPGPGVRMMHLGELTQWNDAPDRTPDEVLALLDRAQRTVDAERAACREERDALLSR